jgi:DNA adenine methylase
MSSKGHTVFISEYEAPNDFYCVWSKEVNVSIRPTKTLKQVEKLFTFEPIKEVPKETQLTIF